MYRYLLKNKNLSILYIAASICVSVMGVLYVMMLSNIINAVILNNSSALNKSIIQAFLFVIAYALVSYATAILNKSVIKTANLNLKNDLIAGLLNSSIVDFESKNTSEYITMITTNIDRYENIYFNTMCNFINIIATFVFSVISSAYISPLLLVVILFFGIIIISINSFTQKYIEKKASEYSIETEVYINFLKEFFGGFNLIKIFNIKKYVIKLHEIHNSNIENKKFLNNHSILIAMYSAMLIGVVSSVIVALIGAWLSIKGVISAGTLIFITHLLGKVISPMERFMQSISMIKSSIPVKMQFEAVLKEEVFVVD